MIMTTLYQATSGYKMSMGMFNIPPKLHWGFQFIKLKSPFMVNIFDYGYPM